MTGDNLDDRRKRNFTLASLTEFLLHPINVILVVCAVFLWLGANADDRTVDAFVGEHLSWQMPDEERLLVLLKATHELLDNRNKSGSLFHVEQSPPGGGLEKVGGVNRRGSPINQLRPPFSVRDVLFPTVSTELMQPCGACASYAIVYCRACQRAGFPARIIHIQSATIPNGNHIACEVELAGRWVYLDPQFNASFRNANGKLATFAETASDWDASLEQANQSTRDVYRAYGLKSQEIERTNWSKIPVVMPTLKWLLDIIMGKPAADEISLRARFLNSYWTYLLGAGFVLVAFNAIRLRRLSNSRHGPVDHKGTERDSRSHHHHKAHRSRQH